LAAAPAAAEVKTSSAYSYYDVYGGTISELATDLAAKGPKDYTGLTASAYNMQWKTRWNGRTCRIVEVVVAVASQILLPRWRPPADAPRALIESWSRSLDALRVHERGHRDIAIQGAQTIDQAVALLPAMKACAKLEKAAKRTAEIVIEDTRRRQERYDRVTDHGRAQGTDLR
jgi:predicted secreted Zn-dependent protease